MVLASLGSALAAAIAARRVQLLGVQAPVPSAVVVTAKLAARTSVTWSQPSATLPTITARCRSRGRERAVVLFGSAKCISLDLGGTRRRRGTLSGRGARGQGKSAEPASCPRGHAMACARVGECGRADAGEGRRRRAPGYGRQPEAARAS